MAKTLIMYLGMALFIAGTLNAQVYLPKKSYMHLVGRIDTDQEITMNLVKIDDSLYADLVFRGEVCNFLVLSGNIADDGNFVLRNPDCDTSAVFQGRFMTRQSIVGTYARDGAEEVEHFVMVENYPEGSIPLMVVYRQFSHQLVSHPGSPEATIMQCLIIPGESSNPVVSDSIRTNMIASFTGKQEERKDPDAVVQSIQETFVRNYMTSNQSLYEKMPDAGSLNWILLKFMHVLYNDNALLCYYLINYAYTGGAHGLETHDFTVISIRSGKILTLGDLFNPGFEAPLTSLLTKKLKDMMGIHQDEKLSDNGFFVDDIVPNSNFYITSAGIGFVYNHYEIAPYVNGPTDILLPFSELANLMKVQGPVPLLLHRR